MSIVKADIKRLELICGILVGLITYIIIGIVALIILIVSPAIFVLILIIGGVYFLLKYSKTKQEEKVRMEREIAEQHNNKRAEKLRKIREDKKRIERQQRFEKIANEMMGKNKTEKKIK